MIEANIKNMKEYHKAYGGNSVFAFSPFTYEKYSANPADYWDAKDDWVMEDSEGNPMALVVEVHTIIDLDDREMLRHHNYDMYIEGPEILTDTKPKQDKETN